MCVRYALNQWQAAINAVAKALGVELGGQEEAPRYNVAPSQLAPIVAAAPDGPRLQAMRWGLIPPADRQLPKPRLLTNARAETMAQFPAFRAAVAQRRCLVPVNGFYEFKDLGARKEPYVLTLPADEPFALGGLWETPIGESAPTFCVVTTEPNAIMQPIHGRMPLILTGKYLALWLGAQPLDERALSETMRQVPAERLQARRVNPYVNNSRHEGPQCLADPEPALPELF